MRRWLAIASVVLVLSFVVAPAGVYTYLRRSLPTIDGTVAVTGLSGPIDIVRDADAIPHIFAATVPDALFGLGYVHAQDRLWQMEFQRRIGHGRLSEIFGAAAVPQDRFLRTVGFGRAANSAWDNMAPWAKDQVNAYVAGVNAFITSHTGSRLPLEFTLLRFRPELWSGPDVIVWVKMMAWDLSANYSFELLRDDLARAVGTGRMQQLMPPYADDGLSILRGVTATSDPIDVGGIGRAAASSLGALDAALSGGVPAARDFLIGGAMVESLGSNNWVVDATRSATGKPLLANDPHLGTKVPSTWYLAHLSAGDFDVIGATLPGTPAVALGRNRLIAWGATNVAADVQDLYREQIDPSGRFAVFRGAQEPLTITPETIQVKGAEPVRFDVRGTRHGPLISDAINAINAARRDGVHPVPLPPLALRWTALDASDSTLPAFLKVNSARNWTEFSDAMRDFIVPSQNFVYGDVNGHIGYYAPGRVPLRARGDGSVPVDGWTGDNEWTGWVPFEGLPHVVDPPEHFIVTANDRPGASAYPYLLGGEWPEPYRAARITELLGATARMTPDDFARIQGDAVSLHAKALLPLLLRLARPVTVEDRQAVDALGHWNGDAAGSSSAAPVFEAWFLRLAAAIAGDELAPPVLDNYAGRYSFVTRFLLLTLGRDDATWCDDVRTQGAETCADTVTAALHGAVEDLGRRMGTDMARWRWDGVHHVVFPHQGLDSVALLGPWLGRSSPTGGDFSTVNVGSVAIDQPYEQHSAAGYRQIIDLSPANDSRFLIDLGESGHVLSKHYDDFLQDWQAVRHRKMRLERAEVEKGAIGTLRLIPRDR
jgi:penicillin amidase